MWLSIENFMEVFVKKFNLKQDSIELGRSDCFFGAMKKLNPVLFRFCCFYSKKSLVEGFNRLISYYKNLKMLFKIFAYLLCSLMTYQNGFMQIIFMLQLEQVILLILYLIKLIWLELIVFIN